MNDVHSMWPLIFVREGYAEKGKSMTDIEQWNKYLFNLSNKPVSLSVKHAEAVRNLWAKLVQLTGCELKTPIGHNYFTDYFQFAWQNGDIHLNIDINANCEFGWFFVNDIDNFYDGSEDEDLTDPPDELIRLLTEHCSTERQSSER